MIMNMSMIMSMSKINIILRMELAYNKIKRDKNG